VDEGRTELTGTSRGQGSVNPVQALVLGLGKTRELWDLLSSGCGNTTHRRPEANRVRVRGHRLSGATDATSAWRAMCSDFMEQVGKSPARVVLWAHNFPCVERGPAGWESYLRPALHDQVYLTGFEFDHGRFTSNLKLGGGPYDAETVGHPAFYAQTR